MQKYLTNHLKWCKVYKHYIFIIYILLKEKLLRKENEMEEKIKYCILFDIYGKERIFTLL